MNNDSNGERLLHAIDNQDIFLHNPNSSTHIDFYRNKKSNLDLILSTMSNADKIHVRIHDETWGSDHYPIFININTEKRYYYKKTFILHSIRTDWKKVLECLEEFYERTFAKDYDSLLASEKYKIFINLITNTIKLYTPKKKKLLIVPCIKIRFFGGILNATKLKD